MSTTVKQLKQELLSSGTPSEGYTAVAVKAIIKEILLCNVSDASAEVTIYAVPNAGTYGDGNTIFSKQVVEPHTTIAITLSTVIEAGGVLQAMCSAASAVCMTLSGVEVA